MTQSPNPTTTRQFVQYFDQSAKDVVTQGIPEDVIVLKKCGHSLSQKSADDLLANRMPCPECRTSFTHDDYVKSVALRSLAEARKNVDTSADEPSPEAVEHFEKAKQFANLGKKDQAVGEIFEALNLHPNYEKAKAYLEFLLNTPQTSSSTPLAELPESAKPPQEAKDAYETGVFFYNQGKYDDAELAFNSALTILPSYTDAKRYLSMISIRRKSFSSVQKPAAQSTPAAIASFSPLQPQVTVAASSPSHSSRDMQFPPTFAPPLKTLPVTSVVHSTAPILIPSQALVRNVPHLSPQLKTQLQTSFGLTDSQIESCTWDLSGQKIDQKKMQILIQALEGCPYVNELILRDSELGQSVLDLLDWLRQHSQITKLDLSHQEVFAFEPFEQLKKLLSAPSCSLAEVNLTNCCIAENRTAQLVAQNTTLTRLNISDNELGEAGLNALGEALSKNPKLPLEVLRLARICQANSKYGKRAISINNMEKFLEWLRVVRQLKGLDLSGNFIDMPAILKALIHNSKLQFTQLHLTSLLLDLKNWPIFANWLKTQVSMTKLSLSLVCEEESYCTSSLENSSHGYQGQGLLNRKEEQQLQSVYKTTSDEGYKHYPKVTHYFYPEQKTIDDHNRNKLTQKKRYEQSLEIWRQAKRRVVEKLFVVVTHSIQAPLEELNLEGSPIGDYGALLLGRALASNSTLQVLNLSKTQLQTPGIHALASATGARQNQVLVVLNLRNNLIFISSNVPYYPSIPETQPAQHTIGSALQPLLTKTITLEKLNLGLDDSFVQQDRDFYVSKKAADAQIQYQASWYAPGNKFGNNWDCRNDMLAKNFQDNTSKFQAEYEANLLQKGSSEIKALAEVLCCCPSLPLRELNLEGVRMGVEGAQALAKWLVHNTSLEKLYLRNTAITSKGMIALAEALNKNIKTALIVLDLRNNAINAEVRFALNDLLPKKTKALIDP